MKTAAWSLALVAGAGSAVAQGSYPTPPGYGSSKSLVPSGTAPSYSYSSGYPASSGFAPSGFAPSGFVPSGAVTKCTTVYTSTCEETSTLIYRSTTSYSAYKVTHLINTTFAGSCPATISASTASSTPVGPASVSASTPVSVYPASGSISGYGGETTTVTDQTTIYTTVYPVTTTQTDGGSTSTSSYLTTSTITTVVPTTIYVYPTQPGGPASYPDGPTTAGPSGPTRTPGEVYTTVYSTEYETVCPGEVKPITWGTFSDLSYTDYSTSTKTDTITTTVTHPYGPATPVGPIGTGGDGGAPVTSTYTSVCTETSTLIYSDTTSYSTYYVTKTITDSETVTDGGSPSATPVGPVDGGSTPAGWSGSWPVPTGSAPAGPGSYSSYYPAGNNTNSYFPTGTTGLATGTVGAKKTSSTCSTPKPTGQCTPCEGQSGTPETFCGLDVNTNSYENVPKTCNTVEYTWEITNQTVAPDGTSRPGLLVNGQMPGPMIHASWGDTVIVHVKNSLPADGRNGTTIHFHGIHQNYTNEYDGVPSITQCPIAPGESFTYQWVATTYGSSWWHSHYALQTYDGIFGPIVIDGPVQSGYEYDDEQVVMMQDWSYETADTIMGWTQQVASGQHSDPTLNTGLINGMNIGYEQPGGQRFEMTVTKGQKYRFRLTNAAIQSSFQFYIDSHKLTVIAIDFVPIVPYTTETIAINIGQRYDVIVEFDQEVGDYWLRTDIKEACGAVQNQDIKGIVHYSGGPDSTPTSSQYTYDSLSCNDEPYDSLVPVVSWNAGSQTQQISEDIQIAAVGQYFKWQLSGTSFFSEWSDPTLESIIDNGTIPDISGNLAIQAPNLGEWVYIVITNEQAPIPHPIHLHGHDFLILAQGTGTYSSSVALNLVNPPRRDVAQMPSDVTTGAGGYLVLAYYTNNPGVWLLHCHIGWHNSMGFALQIIENLDGIKSTVEDSCQLQDTCKTWKAYSNSLTPADTTANSEDDGV